MAKNADNETGNTGNAGNETEAAEVFQYTVKSGRHVRFESGKRVVYSPKSGDENVMELTKEQARVFGKSVERIATPVSRGKKSTIADDTSDTNALGIPDTAEKFIEMIEAEEDLTKLSTYEKHEHARSAGPRKTVLAAIAEQRKLLK